MEIAKVELAAIEKTLIARDIEVKDVRELRELELMLVGGGSGEVVFG